MAVDSITSRLNFKPGFHRESTRYAEEGSWYDGNRVRFREGKPENMRGYAQRVTTAFDGTARDLITWADNDTKRHIMFGTEKKLYSYDGDNNIDITPLVSSVALTSAFATTDGSTRIYVSAAGHNLSQGDFITFTSSKNTIGGTVDLTNQVCSVSIININSFAIQVSTAADATETSVGTADMGYLIPTGNTNAIQGLGYGAAIYQATISTTGYRAWNEPASASGISFGITQWSLDTWGEDVLMNRKGGKIYYYDTDVSTEPTRGTVVTASPTVTDSILVSPNDRHVIAFGSTEFGTGTYNPLLVRWSDQEDYNNWTPAVSTTSGETILTDGSRIVAGVRSKNIIGVFTDNALYGMQFVGPPFIFNFRQLGTACGLVSQHGAVDIDGRLVWMGDNNFFLFDGQVRNLPCTVRRYIYDSFNMSQKDKVYAGINSEFKEVIWLYPSASSDECDSYVIWNYANNTWVYGTILYTTFQDRTVYDNTIATSNTSYLYNNEPEDVYSGDGDSLTAYVESADFDIDDGHKMMFIDKIIPDFTINDGNITMSIKTKQYPAGPLTEKGPFNITAETQRINMRARGRQARVRVSSYTNNTYWRYGAVRLDLKPDGQA